MQNVSVPGAPDVLTERFAVIRDGHPESTPASGLWLASEPTAEAARNAAQQFSGDLHIFDTVSGDWESVESVSPV